MYTRNHVIGDLEPFICVFSQCQGGGHRGGTGPLTFETSKAWSNHMQTAHGHAWECRAPSHDPIVFEQEIHYQEHSVTQHGVPEAHVGTLSRAARRPILDKVLKCPFGDDFQPPDKQPPDKVESSAVFWSEALQSHVAGHMKEIALLALQKLPSDDDENVENVDSDQPLEDDGLAGVVGAARQSMYSVLEDDDLDFQDDDTGDADDNPERHEEEISARVTELDLGDKDELGMRKLHHAVRAGDLDLVESVIQSGASVDCRDENGSTPLHYAAEGGLVKCVAVLVEHGADILITDNSGFSPFLWAVVAGQEDATAELLSMGVDANSPSADGHSALAWAVWDGSQLLKCFWIGVPVCMMPEIRSRLRLWQKRQLLEAFPLLNHSSAVARIPTIVIAMDGRRYIGQQRRAIGRS
jgi:Ankyrin repeats (3 copies)